MDSLSKAEIAAFRALVLNAYAEAERSFPWRYSRDPWAILVSEIMLQQTQTGRVVPKYQAFLDTWPNPGSLAQAKTAEILLLWSGLGYNRRALSLQRSAVEVVSRFGGLLPDNEEDLLSLPGVGPYTARAVLAFAWGRPVTLIETNIRSVYLHHFFPGADKVPDSLIAPLVEWTLFREDPRTWYYALMDYGVAIKRDFGNPNKRSAHYSMQTPFADSHRRIRGALIRALGDGPRDREAIAAHLPFARERIDKAMTELVAEGFLEEYGSKLRLSGSAAE